MYIDRFTCMCLHRMYVPISYIRTRPKMSTLLKLPPMNTQYAALWQWDSETKKEGANQTMSEDTHVYVHIYMYKCIYICIYMYAYICMHIYLHIHISLYTYIYICIYIYIHLHIHIYIFMYTYVYIYICIHMYVGTVSRMT